MQRPFPPRNWQKTQIPIQDPAEIAQVGIEALFVSSPTFLNKLALPSHISSSMLIEILIPTPPPPEVFLAKKIMMPETVIDKSDCE